MRPFTHILVTREPWIIRKTKERQNKDRKCLKKSVICIKFVCTLAPEKKKRKKIFDLKPVDRYPTRQILRKFCSISTKGDKKNQLSLSRTTLVCLV